MNQGQGKKNWPLFRYPIYFILSLIVISGLIHPFTQNVMLTLEISVYFATLVTLSIVGCSIEYRHRSLFMFHYHGTRTIVMDELTQEMSED